MGDVSRTATGRTQVRVPVGTLGKLWTDWLGNSTGAPGNIQKSTATNQLPKKENAKLKWWEMSPCS